LYYHTRGSSLVCQRIQPWKHSKLASHMGTPSI
jgi:hypothetical protein